MAISKDIWDKAKTLYESGKLSLSEISARTGIDKSSISKKAKIQQWKSGENADYIEAKILIAEKKSILNQQKINILDDIADEKTKHLIYFQNSALENQRVANEMLKNVDKMQDVESHSRITSKNKETVLGKDIDTVINNSNNQQNIITVEIE